MNFITPRGSFINTDIYISNDGRRILMVVEQLGIRQYEEVDIFQNPAILMSFLSIKYRLSVIKSIFSLLFKDKIDQI